MYAPPVVGNINNNNIAYCSSSIGSYGEEE